MYKQAEAAVALSEAEACFQRALDVARRQEAKSLELRAAMRLARLWQQQGKRAEAYGLLAPIYGWFTEGFDTADLQEAKALLEALVSDRMTIPKIMLVELVWQGCMEPQLAEKMLEAMAPRYAPGFIPHMLTMLERGKGAHREEVEQRIYANEAA